MGSGPTIVRLARGGSSAVDLDTEAGRAFVQERLALYNKLAFIISGAWWQRWRARHTGPAEDPR